MITTDLHTHTVRCDGKSTPEEMARAAADAGMTCLGFSGHSYTAFDESYCMSREGTAAYLAEIAALRELYAGKLRILCGIEQDYYSAESTAPYDYVIGSAHYICKDGVYLPVDESPEKLRKAVRRHFGGDWYAMTEAYFSIMGGMVEKTGCDIVGHFDLVAKFNETERFFDERHPRYVRAWQAALDRLLPQARYFEINTGAMSRGYRSVPYPNADMIAYIRSRGGRLILSSDSHSAATLCYGFSQYEALAEEPKI